MRLPVLTAQCDGCGLCCKGHMIVKANAVDCMREPRIRQERRRMIVNGELTENWLMNVDGDEEPGACAYYDEPGKRCTIYATRPGPCVGFQAGNPVCLQLRQAAGLGPLAIVQTEYDEQYATFGIGEAT